jgi:hypothetical protein
LQDILHEEVKSHYRTWKKRWAHYQRVEWDASQVQANLKAVIHGEKPRLPPRKEAVPLQLAASVGAD